MNNKYIQKVQVARNTGLDFLRCIAMLMIVMLHICVHGLKISELETNVYFIRGYTDLICFIVSVCSIAVNIFFIFSGYFATKFKWGKLIKLYLEVAVYSGICYLINEFVVEKSEIGIIHSILRLGKNCIMGFSWYWFVVAYILLYMVSPFIKEYLDSIPDRKVMKFTWIIILINVFFGFVLKSSVYGGPRTILPAICMFVLGYCMKREINILKKYFNVLILVYILSVGLTFLGGVILIRWNQNLAWRWMTDYNSPFLILSSIALFSLFCVSNEKFDNKYNQIFSGIISTISKSTFAVYLLSDNTWTRQWIYSFLNKIISGVTSSIDIALIILVYGILIFSCCIIFDLLRKMITKRCFCCLKSFKIQGGQSYI